MLLKGLIAIILQRVFKVAPAIHIVLHGYGNAIPDGRGVINGPANFHFIGPWFRPWLGSCRIEWSVDGRKIVARLIDLHNIMLRKLASELPSQIHYIDLRPTIEDEDWVNELHLHNSGFRKVAARFHDTMVSVD